MQVRLSLFRQKKLLRLTALAHQENDFINLPTFHSVGRKYLLLEMIVYIHGSVLLWAGRKL